MKAIFIVMPIAMLAMLAASASSVMAVFPCGDVNCDGDVTTHDISLLRNRVYQGQLMESEWAGDVNCDGFVTTHDISLLRNRVYQGATLNCCICKVFAEHVNDYSALPGYYNLDYTDENAQGFYVELCGDTYWDGGGFYSDNDSWEVDFKDPIHGGTDIADNAEFAYFVGHGRLTSGGDLAAFIFNSTTNDHYLTCEDALWGNTKLNWIAIDSCEVLSHYALTWGCWADNAFEGLHSICGWDTACNDTTFRGRYFARHMDGTWHEWTIIEAWKRATKESQGPGYYAAAMTARDYPGHEWDCWDDHLYSHGPSVEPPVNPPAINYTRWDCE